jgi:transposase
MNFIAPQDRNQLVFLNRLDDMVASDHLARLIDKLVDVLVNENESLFVIKGLKGTGRRPYHPATLLKLYIYGYMNGVSSSRRLETECNRNIEVIWLLGTLAPDHKTIADYRKDNKEQIQFAFQRFIIFLKEHSYIKGETLSIDGSRIRANANRLIRSSEVEKQLENLNQQLGEYLTRLDLNDVSEDQKENVAQLAEEQQSLQQSIVQLKQQIEQLEKHKEYLSEQQLEKYSPTDVDALLMKGREGKHLSYNIQTAVDAEQKLIAAIDVADQNNDKGLLTPMVHIVEQTLQTKPKEIIADGGYSNLTQIRELEQEQHIDCYVALNSNFRRSRDQAHGIHFTYDPVHDQYHCSQNEPLILKEKNKVNKQRRTSANVYEGIHCEPCPLKSLCTQGKTARQVYRYHDQTWKNDYRAKILSAHGIQKLKLRKCLSEHPFGTLKRWMGKLPIKVRGRSQVKTEMNLYALAYNLKRMKSIESFNALIEKIVNYEWKAAV